MVLKKTITEPVILKAIVFILLPKAVVPSWGGANWQFLTSNDWNGEDGRHTFVYKNVTATTCSKPQTATVGFGQTTSAKASGVKTKLMCEFFAKMSGPQDGCRMSRAQLTAAYKTDASAVSCGGGTGAGNSAGPRLLTT